MQSRPVDSAFSVLTLSAKAHVTLSLHRPSLVIIASGGGVCAAVGAMTEDRRVAEGAQSGLETPHFNSAASIKHASTYRSASGVHSRHPAILPPPRELLVRHASLNAWWAQYTAHWPVP
jgi:hypothetical protein